MCAWVCLCKGGCRSLAGKSILSSCISRFPPGAPKPVPTRAKFTQSLGPPRGALRGPLQISLQPAVSRQLKQSPVRRCNIAPRLAVLSLSQSSAGHRCDTVSLSLFRSYSILYCTNNNRGKQRKAVVVRPLQLCMPVCSLHRGKCVLYKNLILALRISTRVFTTTCWGLRGWF